MKIDSESLEYVTLNEQLKQKQQDQIKQFNAKVHLFDLWETVESKSASLKWINPDEIYATATFYRNVIATDGSFTLTASTIVLHFNLNNELIRLIAKGNRNQKVIFKQDTFIAEGGIADYDLRQGKELITIMQRPILKIGNNSLKNATKIFIQKGSTERLWTEGGPVDFKFFKDSIKELK